MERTSASSGLRRRRPTPRVRKAGDKAGEGGRGKGPPPLSPRDQAGMREALCQAQCAAGLHEVPIGAAVLRDGAVIARAHNETRARGDPTAHAELLAIQGALGALRTDRLEDCTLYVTLEPCAQCAGAMVLAKVGRVVFGAYDPKAGVAGGGGGLPPRPPLQPPVGGVRGGGPDTRRPPGGGVLPRQG